MYGRLQMNDLPIQDRNGTKYLSWSDIPDSEKKIQELWWQRQQLQETATGYGSRLTTTRMIRMGERWRRVYCACFSNSGTCYIEIGKNKEWLTIID